MIEVAEEFVEAVHRRQKLVAIAEVVFAELSADIALRFEQFCNGRVLRLQTKLRPRQADLGQTGADRRLPGDEGGPARGAALLAIPVGEHSAFFCDAVDVGGLVPHHAVVLGADIEPGNVIAPDDKNVRLFLSHDLFLLFFVNSYQLSVIGHRLPLIT